MQFGISSRHISVKHLTAFAFLKLDTVSLTFTNQKNGIKGEAITYGRISHPWDHPIHRVLGRVLYLLNLKFPSSTPYEVILPTITGTKLRI